MNARSFLPALFLLALLSASCASREKEPRAGAKADSMVNAILDNSSQARKADSTVRSHKEQRRLDSISTAHKDSALVDSLAQKETELPQDNRRHPPPLPLEPRYKEGNAAMEKFLAANTKYPEAAQKAGVKGIVYVYFIVLKDGTLDNFKVLRGLGYGCDEEAIRVVKSMPPWEPGRVNGKPADMEYSVAVKFGE